MMIEIELERTFFRLAKIGDDELWRRGAESGD